MTNLIIDFLFVLQYFSREISTVYPPIRLLTNVHSHSHFNYPITLGHKVCLYIIALLSIIYLGKLGCVTEFPINRIQHLKSITSVCLRSEQTHNRLNYWL